MQIEINGKQHDVKFNMGFIRQLDKLYSIEQNGLKFGQGVQVSYPQVSSGSLTALADVLFAATKNTTMNEIDEAIEEYAENDQLQDLIDEVVENFKNSSMTKVTVAQVDENLKNVQANAYTGEKVMNR